MLFYRCNSYPDQINYALIALLLFFYFSSVFQKFLSKSLFFFFFSEKNIKDKWTKMDQDGAHLLVYFRMDKLFKEIIQ